MDAFFEGSPIEKWLQIIQNASPTLVALELENLLERFVVYEMLLEKNGIDVNKDFAKYRFSEDILARINEAKNALAIESMANILSNHE